MKAMTNYRHYVLSALAAVAVIGVLSEPAENDNWLAVLAASKAAGLTAGYLACRLAAYWEKRGKIRIPDKKKFNR